MKRRRLAFVVTLAVLCAIPFQSFAELQGSPNMRSEAAGFPRVSEVIASIQIHGNNVTPEADVLAIAGVKRGEVFTADTIALVRRRLEASRRFEGVDVRKRFASIADLSQIALVIVVDEHAVTVRPAGSRGPDEAPVRVTKRGVLGGAMFLPLVSYDDGYGLAYGVVVAYPGVGARRSRLAFPLTWGGTKRAAAEYETPITRGPVGRLRGGAAIERRTNPFFQDDDGRRRAWIRAETRLRWNAGAGATGAIERVAFGGARDVWRSATVDVTLDTRRDPVFPRNAVLASASRTYLRGDAAASINRSRLQAAGYLGFVRGSVAMLSLEYDTASRRLPDYFKPLLGGWSSVRGLRAGSFAGDNRLGASLELRVPVSSPLSVAHTGISVFVDRGKVFDAGQARAGVPWQTGTGASVWVSATVVRAGISVARANGRTRANVGISVIY